MHLPFITTSNTRARSPGYCRRAGHRHSRFEPFPCKAAARFRAMGASFLGRSHNIYAAFRQQLDFFAAASLPRRHWPCSPPRNYRDAAALAFCFSSCAAAARTPTTSQQLADTICRAFVYHYADRYARPAQPAGHRSVDGRRPSFACAARNACPMAEHDDAPQQPSSSASRAQPASPLDF